MEPKREHGDDRVMWKIISPRGDSCYVEAEGDARDMAESDTDNAGVEYAVEQVLVTAEEWNEMPEFEGW